jgi:hypothetical protein
MSHRQKLSPSLLAGLGVAVLPAVARAQTIPPACRPLIEAEKKVLMTPNHAYTTERPARPSGQATTHEVISAGGAMYILHGGSWRRSPLTTQAALEQMEQNLTDTKQYSCRHVGDEAVNGVPAAVYVAHSETEDLKADARTWVATSSGLVLRTEEDLDTGNGDTRHVSIRYEYANVRVPAAVR